MALLIYDPDVPNIERQHEQLAVPNRIVLLRSGDAPQHGATMTFSLDFNHGGATESRRSLRSLVTQTANGTPRGQPIIGTGPGISSMPPFPTPAYGRRR